MEYRNEDTVARLQLVEGEELTKSKKCWKERQRAIDLFRRGNPSRLQRGMQVDSFAVLEV